MYVGELVRVIIPDEVFYIWFVLGMTTEREMETGLNQLPHLIKHNGVLADFGERKQSQVKTTGLLFNIDIVYLNEIALEENDEGEMLGTLEVVDIVKDVAPGYVVTQELLARFVLEMNAGESDVINIGDRYELWGTGYIPLGYIPVISS